ncbi:MAG: YfiR family protein [Gammaproteobacteria bacterium]
MIRTSFKPFRRFLGYMLLCALMPPGQARTLEEHTVLAALTLNIVRFTSWPESVADPAGEELHLCLVGDNATQQSFLSIDHRSVDKKTVRIVNLSHLLNLEQCRVLYVSELKQNLLTQVFLELKNKPVLTIGESHEFAAQGGMVGLENVDGKINLFVNLSAMRESGLQISSRLLKLAKIVGEAVAEERLP